MLEPIEPKHSHTWLLRYVLTAQTSVIIMLGVFYFTGFHNLVTHEDLKSLPYPYLIAEDGIVHHIEQSEKTIAKITQTLTELNERITKEAHRAELHITLLEEKMKRIKAR